MTVTFSRAWSAPRELDYLRESLATGQTAGDSVFTKRCHQWLQHHYGCERAFLTPSCTAALEMCALLLKLEPGDEIIVPSFTFVTSASAFALFGAKIIFGDVRADTLTLDLDQLPQLVTAKTRAIVMVHYSGISHDPMPLVEFCRERNIMLIEDNAHALGGSFNGRKLGTFGALATLSFHESKNFSCGEGGALLVNDPALVARAEILREKGTNRSAHLRKEIGKYSWVDLGSSYLASDLCAAALLAQLEDFDEIQTRRRTRWEAYVSGLKHWALASEVQLPIVPEGCFHASHLFHLIFKSNEHREAAIQWMREADIGAYFHYLPLHLSPQGQERGAAPLGCPVTESASQRLLRLPLYPALTEEQQRYVIERLIAFPGVEAV